MPVSHADKVNLLTQLKAHLELELETLSASAKSAHEAATHTESRPENKYDTRGLEASYLAGAQKRRSEELASMIGVLGQTVIRSFLSDATIATTALVELELDEVRSFWFLMPAGAGYVLDLAGKRVQAITLQSPLGAALSGKKVGDLVRVSTATGGREYEVMAIS